MLQMQLNVAGRPQCCGPTGPLWGSAASTQPLSALMRGASGEMQGTSRKLPDASLSSRCQLCILSSLVRDHGQPRKDFLWPRDRPLQAVGALGSAPVKVNTPAARRQPAQSSPPRWGLLGPGWGQLWGWGQGKVHLGKGCSLRERERETHQGASALPVAFPLTPPLLQDQHLLPIQCATEESVQGLHVFPLTSSTRKARTPDK